MDILVSTLCDFAADYQGKLCIQGGFDSLVARQFPVVHPVCAVALRICLTPEDEGTHELGLSIVDADGTPLDKEPCSHESRSAHKAFPPERRRLSGLRTEKLFEEEPRLIFLFY